ncbi:MAG: hypothetical protein A2161_20305 [Candidatus Schekmanbacteria bacterium RBG_13_48_7]|uniref:Uncharacterized protein n=1 Tax=Candidatus Schekmanbacteria bacterium RBG_13_48_7 TaxID=1817878 RepID=A0A1F7RJK2_9BACT|nr:MAG: hypothetical protein A2161_20305 [Candidatus Schekmanbacteria bacterium RBG_13_48_7]
MTTELKTRIGYGLEYNNIWDQHEGSNPCFGMPDNFTSNHPFCHIPYYAPAIVASGNINLADRGEHSAGYVFIHGILYSPGTINIHNTKIEGTNFIYGAELCSVVDNGLWLKFYYDPSSIAAGNRWFWIDKPDSVALTDWRVVK